MNRSQLLFFIPALLSLVLVGCSDGGNSVPERGMAKKYVEDFPDLVAAQKAADDEAERENKNNNN